MRILILLILNSKYRSLLNEHCPQYDPAESKLLKSILTQENREIRHYTALYTTTYRHVLRGAHKSLCHGLRMSDFAADAKIGDFSLT
jgi:hypothetical protein